MYQGKKLEDCDVVVNPYTGKTINMKQVVKDVSLAISVLNSNYPFFSNLFRKLHFQYSFAVPTACTDGVRMIVNPEFFEGLNIRQKVFIIMHEIMHCALTHMTRAQEHGFDNWKANIAGDYEINGLMEQDGLVSASDLSGFLYDKQIAVEHWSFERIYAANKPGPQQPKQQTPSQDDNNDQSSSSDADSDNSNNKPKSKDWVDGWNDALDAYKSGKLKI